jgi:YHS domain-containing protein
VVAAPGGRGPALDLYGPVAFAFAMKVKDPVCGMTVDSERAPARGTYEGQPVAFCSAACQATYERSHGARRP